MTIKKHTNPNGSIIEVRLGEGVQLSDESKAFHAVLSPFDFDPADFPGFTHVQIVAGLVVPACGEME